VSGGDWGADDEAYERADDEHPASPLAAEALAGLRAGMGAAVDRAVQRRLDALAADAVDEALTDDVLADLAAAARAGATEVVSPDQAPQLYYASLPEFVGGFLAGVYARNFDTKGRTWCPAWWNHTEAVVRLDALWRAWEHLRHDPALGISTWLRDHGDHHMTALMAQDGPFQGCTPTRGHTTREWRCLPIEPPPGSLFVT